MAILSLAITSGLSAQGYKFTDVVSLKTTPVKNQASTGTCWCFATTSFFETELLRQGKGEYDLSEMFIVRQKYFNQTEDNFLRQGRGNVGQGSLSHTWINAFKMVGIVPEEVYSGINYDSKTHNHSELAQYIAAIAQTSVKLKKRSPQYYEMLNNVFDTYLGKIPETFTYKGKQYTPKSFAASLGLNMDDYVNITSFTHHPFYETFAIEVQDNWRGGQAYNLPLDEMMQIFDYAINNGYTIAWGADVSETGFSRQTCVGVIPDVAATPDLTGSDMVRWTGLTEAEKRTESITRPGPELKITQEMRQEGYNNFETTDDHGMQIFGIAKDQTGKEYYMVKNSWGTSSKYKGIWYVSKAFVAYKTMNFVVNKNGIPKEIKAKLGIK